MQNEWQGFNQVSCDVMLEKVATGFSKEGLTTIATAICHLPNDKKFISKTEKLINDRKTMFLNLTN